MDRMWMFVLGPWLVALAVSANAQPAAHFGLVAVEGKAQKPRHFAGASAAQLGIKSRGHGPHCGKR